ncbi:hypothetical protein D7B24_001939 [Verticillium nonalfalfae]|uniref:Thioesterase domain-containing protein n=1 Tax=Verticillium nonalfalfae TaxID=1051616 RepID=A0A3M9XYS8_9PEZI|nr:uncharacterized protein D7B24_001939 [Verticillium nonalfalfae]RNJ53417.1 hypothetical protein D7B24_001939 [Verticillium nonalfalfae]
MEGEAAKTKQTNSDVLAMTPENPDLQHFLSIPWCAAHLTPSTIYETPVCRFPKLSGEDNLFATVLNAPGAIKAFLSFHEAPAPDAPPLVEEIDFFVTIGTDVAGHPSLCHGGLIAALMDEVLGLTMAMNKSWGAVSTQAHMTGYLNINYLKPVPVPATYLCRAKVLRIEGRKSFLLGTVEDEQGAVLVKADSLFIDVKGKL